MLGRDLSRLVIIDNNPAMFVLHPDNGVPIASWYGGTGDRELLALVPMLCHLADVPDVRPVLRSVFNISQHVAASAAT
jgi:TFIIF-interacting CTD phosphatase-like protein